MRGNNVKKCILGTLLSLCSAAAIAQSDTVYLDSRIVDSLYIYEVEERKEPAKILHAEPLYIDLIRDLGARKGEKEWNVAFGMTDNVSYDEYEALVEYEWAPFDRVGFEIEVPFTIIGSYKNGQRASDAPGSKINGLKTAVQWTFLVNEKWKTSMALGYINEVEFNTFREFGNPLLTGNVYNPFFIAAKRWGMNYHTLVYTGPMVYQHFGDPHLHAHYHVNTNLHYMLPGTRNFIGIEFNKIWQPGDFDMTIRPQMRLGITDNFLIGIVAGIPAFRENERMSMFTRIIWEPGHKHRHHKVIKHG
ncbi:HAEPLYID family protein [Cytophagaceae bacterium ABcell3]|nr:HAEPLYID family protein [Cytophagaceae bacterium ABcell3]